MDPLLKKKKKNRVCNKSKSIGYLLLFKNQVLDASALAKPLTQAKYKLMLWKILQLGIILSIGLFFIESSINL